MLSTAMVSIVSYMYGFAIHGEGCQRSVPTQCCEMFLYMFIVPKITSALEGLDEYKIKQQPRTRTTESGENVCGDSRHPCSSTGISHVSHAK